jgi:glycosyltransferase involved in cell wall biosynthesis
MRAIVVDNGSSDGSGEVARAHGALVVVEPRRGFGSACHAGLLAATAPVVAFMDADSSFDPLGLTNKLGMRVGVEGVVPFAVPVVAGEDAVVGEFLYLLVLDFDAGGVLVGV